MERIKKNDLVELAKKLELDPKFVTDITGIIYENEEQGDAKLTIEMLEKHLGWVKSEEIISTEQYQDIVNEVKRQNEMITSLESDVVTREEMRKKLGYNNSEWKKIESLEKTMITEIKKLILEYMGINLLVPEALKADTLKDNPTYIAMDKRWREFARNYVIPNYPGAIGKKGKSMRTRMTGLFSTKLIEALK